MIKAWFYISTEKLWYRANCLLFSGLAALSILNARYISAGGSTVNRGHEHQRSIKCCSARAGRPRRFGGTQRDSGT